MIIVVISAMGRDATVCLPCCDTPILRHGAKCKARIFLGVGRHFDGYDSDRAHTVLNCRFPTLLFIHWINARRVNSLAGLLIPVCLVLDKVSQTSEEGRTEGKKEPMVGKRTSGSSVVHLPCQQQRRSGQAVTRMRHPQIPSAYLRVRNIPGPPACGHCCSRTRSGPARQEKHRRP